MNELTREFNACTPDLRAHKVGPAGIDIAYQRVGNAEAPIVLLIMGIAAQSIHWPKEFCNALVEQGLQVIRFDNRDSGLSTHMELAPKPDLPAVLNGELTSVSYTLSDMAADTVGLLDELGIEKAHIVGASMGGQIAQMMAIESPHRVRSLTSIMSTTGALSVGQSAPGVLRELFSGPPAVNRETVILQFIRASRIIGSPGYPSDEREIAEIAGRAFDRSYDPLGSARQAVATVASGDRTEKLRNLQIPTLVIHGMVDRMCDVSGGQATAKSIPGAELVLIDEMGHNLAGGLRSRLASLIAEFVWRIERE